MAAVDATVAAVGNGGKIAELSKQLSAEGTRCCARQRS
jgi:hypothetical protein